MLKDFLKIGSLYLISTVFTKGLGLIFFPIYALCLDPEHYSVVDLLGVFASLCSVVLAFEIVQALCRYFHEPEGDDKTEIFSSIFWFVAISGFVFGTVCLFLSDYISLWVTGSSENAFATKLCIIGIFLGCLCNVTNSHLRLSFKAGKFAIVAISQAVATAICSVVFLFGLELKAEGVILGLVVGQVINLSISLIFTMHHLRLRFNKKLISKMLQFSLPLVPSSLGVVLALYIDRVVVKEMMSLEDVGILGTSYRFASVATLLSSSVISAVSPLIYKKYREAEAPAEIANVFSFMVFLSLVLVFTLFAFGSEFVQLLLRSNYGAAGEYVWPLTLGIFVSNFYIFAPGLVIAKKTKMIAMIGIFSALCNLGLNILLIPVAGLQGVVVSTVTASVLGFILYVVLGRKLYSIPYEIENLVKVIGVFIVGSGIVYALDFLEIPMILLCRAVVVCVAVLLAIHVLGYQKKIHAMLRKHTGNSIE